MQKYLHLISEMRAKTQLKLINFILYFQINERRLRNYLDKTRKPSAATQLGILANTATKIFDWGFHQRRHNYECTENDFSIRYYCANAKNSQKTACDSSWVFFFEHTSLGIGYMTVSGKCSEKCKLIERTFRLLQKERIKRNKEKNICFCDKKYTDEFLRAHINTHLISNNNYFNRQK